MVALFAVSTSSWYSLRKLMRTTLDKSKIRRACIRRFYLLCVLLSALGVSLGGLVPSARSQVVFEMDEEDFLMVMFQMQNMFGYFALALSTFQLQKYWVFVFKEKMSRLLFPLIHTMLTACMFITAWLGFQKKSKVGAQFWTLQFAFFCNDDSGFVSFGFFSLEIWA